MWPFAVSFRAINGALAAMNGRPVSSHMGKKLRYALGSSAPKVEGPVRQVLETGEPIFNRDLTAKLPGRLEVGLWVGNHRALLGWNCWLASASCRADRRLYPVCKKHHHQLATVFFCRCPRLQLDHGTRRTGLTEVFMEAVNSGVKCCLSANTKY